MSTKIPQRFAIEHACQRQLHVDINDNYICPLDKAEL